MRSSCVKIDLTAAGRDAEAINSAADDAAVWEHENNVVYMVDDSPRGAV